MKKKTALSTGLSVALLLGLLTTSFAGAGIPGNSPHIGTEAGVGIAASPEARAAALNFDYGSYDPTVIGTEVGAMVIAGERARNAAANYRYIADLLALAGTESGQFPAGVGLGTGSEHWVDGGAVADERRENTNAICPC